MNSEATETAPTDGDLTYRETVAWLRNRAMQLDFYNGDHAHSLREAADALELRPRAATEGAGRMKSERQHAREGGALGGAGAQALEGALTLTETERDEARERVEVLTTALCKSTQLAATMSNVCWSLGHADREVGAREPLAKLARDWDEFSDGLRAILSGADVPTREPRREIHGEWVPGNWEACPLCGQDKCMHTDEAKAAATREPSNTNTEGGRG